MMACSCMKLELNGIPCSHAFAVMKVEDMDKVFKCCINVRWTRHAKPTHKCTDLDQLEESAIEIARFGALHAISNQICFNVAKTQKGYDGDRDCITNSSSYFNYL